MNLEPNCASGSTWVGCSTAKVFAPPAVVNVPEVDSTAFIPINLGSYPAKPKVLTTVTLPALFK